MPTELLSWAPAHEAAHDSTAVQAALSQVDFLEVIWPVPSNCEHPQEKPSSNSID
jgi:hypothetical protein